MRRNEGKINYTQFVIVCVIGFSIFLSNQMVVNTVTKFASTMEVSTTMLGFIGGMWGMAALVTRPFAGQVVDNEAHKPLLITCIGILVFSNVVLIVADNVVFILLSRFVNGIAWGFGSTVCMTTACDSLPNEKISSGIAIYTLMQTLGQVIGPAIAIEIMERGGFRLLYTVTGLIMAVGFLLSFSFRTSHMGLKEKHYSFSLSSMLAPKAFLPASLLACNTMETSSIAAFILIYADSIGVTGLSLFFTVQALAIIITRPFVSKVISDRNKYAFTIVSELMIICALVSLLFVRSALAFMACAVFFGLGKSGAQPALAGMCVSAVGKEERGRASNTTYTFQDIGQIIGSNLAGFLAGFVGYGGAFACMGGIISAVLIIFIVFYMRPDLRRKA